MVLSRFSMKLISNILTRQNYILWVNCASFLRYDWSIQVRIFEGVPTFELGNESTMAGQSTFELVPPAKKSTQKLIRKGKIRVFPKKFSKILRVIHAKTTRDISNLTTDLNLQQNCLGQEKNPVLADHPVIHWSTDRLKPFSAGLPVKSHTTWSCDTSIESL